MTLNSCHQTGIEVATEAQLVRPAQDYFTRPAPGGGSGAVDCSSIWWSVSQTTFQLLPLGGSSSPEKSGQAYPKFTGDVSKITCYLEAIIQIYLSSCSFQTVSLLCLYFRSKEQFTVGDYPQKSIILGHLGPALGR